MKHLEFAEKEVSCRSTSTVAASVAGLKKGIDATAV
jgi:hypothetical protein